MPVAAALVRAVLKHSFLERRCRGDAPRSPTLVAGGRAGRRRYRCSRRAANPRLDDALMTECPRAGPRHRSAPSACRRRARCRRAAPQPYQTCRCACRARHSTCRRRSVSRVDDFNAHCAANAVPAVAHRFSCSLVNGSAGCGVHGSPRPCRSHRSNQTNAFPLQHRFRARPVYE